MRKVKRIATPPSLRRPELLDWAQALTEFYSRPADERQRQRVPFEQYARLFLAGDVRSALEAQFEQKCAYCEARLLGDGAIEQFRPVFAAADADGGAESPDHYGWLAFEWRNLMLACRECAAAKRNRFPVDTPRALPMTPWRSAVASEGALLLDPCRDDPKRHLGFSPHGELVAASERGAATIGALGLNRPGLIAARRAAMERMLGAIVAQPYRLDEGFAVSELDTLRRFAHTAAVDHALLTVYGAFARRLGLRVERDFRFARDLPRLLGHEQEWESAAHAYLDDRPDEAPEEFDFDPPPRAARAPEPRWDPSYVERVRIFHFKGIEQVELNLGAGTGGEAGAPGAMLLGENAAGKSTVLQALALALMDERQRNGSRAQGLEFLPRQRDSWDVSIQRPYVEVLLSSGESRRVEIDSLGRFQTHAGGPPSMVLAYGARRFFRAHGRIPAHGIHRSLFDPFAVLEDPSTWLTEAPRAAFDAVARAMREIFALHGDDDIFRNHSGHVLVRAHGRVTPIERMSDGYRALFAMAVDIMRRMVEAWGNLEYAQGTVLIDEIDVHLHPRWKIEVMSALRRAMPRVQFVVSAHDALCLRGMRDGEVHVLYRDEDDRIRAREDLPNIELLRTDQLLTSDIFGLASTARPETEAALNRYAYLLGLPEPRAEEALERRRLGAALQALPRGDTPAEQLIGEATERYIEGRRRGSAIERGAMREDALDEIVRRLERHLGVEADG
ncbi:AAA family ATPase [Lysobacter sp. BMK333-48F3]|uniref:AAA family ATPase n=1 Tax=Lysobacter sp. BMK333-48F3 TaxID=2867962 RepID=UPI001C8C99D1|nr:AAA family ATPase [Lysobacter sp. BMK333-48F3]MBX9402339.1 AAA family ATPase [Lysobacter sp. BMK333-48F3]